MRALGSQMERLIEAANGEAPGSAAVPSKYATAEQMERLIAAMSGGGGLPAVTPSDAGDVLTVNENGEWDKASGPTVFAATVVLSYSGGTWSATSETDGADIMAAINAGDVPIVIAEYDSGDEVYHFAASLKGCDGETYSVFRAFTDEGDSVSIGWDLGNDDQWSLGVEVTAAPWLADIPSPSDANPQAPGTAAPGTSADYSRADHVHPTDTSRLAADQGVGNAGKFLVVGSDGMVVPVTMTAWQGGNY